MRTQLPEPTKGHHPTAATSTPNGTFSNSGRGTVPTVADDIAEVAVDAPSAARHLCSFSGETEVLMADGTTKPISEVEVGDWVLAEDPETGERGAREVTHLWVHQDTIIDLEIDGHDVATTEDHPFWNHTDQEWQAASALDVGDLVLTADGATLTVDGMDWGSARTTTAYNLTVDDIHTYFVYVRDDAVLVHNVCLGDDWVAREVPDLISTSDCRSCAADILDRLGQGELVTVTPRGSAPGLGG